jgi:hypothetical protein
MIDITEKNKPEDGMCQPNYSCIMTGSWDKTLKVTYSLQKSYILLL